MHQMRDAILERDSYESLGLQRNLGDAFAVVCRFFGHTAKPVSEALRMDKKAAVNALDGKAGVPVITKALQARQKASGDHYELWLALGEMIFGESLDEYEERKLQLIIESTQNAQSLFATRQTRREYLRSRSAAPDSGEADGPVERRLA